MKKQILTTLFAVLSSASFAQFGEGFESTTLDSGKVLNGMLGETEFKYEYGFTNLHLPTFWDTSFGGYWASGWAISRKYDSVTILSDFDRHLYCAKPFKGNDTSRTFAVGQNYTELYRDRASKTGITAIHLTNTTYTYNSMKLGDAFAKKFGGSSGHDSDYFYCRIKTYHFGDFLDSQDVYLADFRFSNDSLDYILDEWKRVTLHPLTDSVIFTLYSSDNSSWGMNTPGFFALDDIEYTIFENTTKQKQEFARVWPNPALDVVHVFNEKGIRKLNIFNTSGCIITSAEMPGNSEAQIQTSGWSNGIYIAEIHSATGVSRVRFIVQN